MHILDLLAAYMVGEEVDPEDGAFLPLIPSCFHLPSTPSREPCFPQRHCMRTGGKRGFRLQGVPTLARPPAWNAALDPFTPRTMGSRWVRKLEIPSQLAGML